MKYIQWYHASTGYIPDSSPPQYHPDYVKPIPACGTDGVIRLDGRFALHNMVTYATALLEQAKQIGDVHRARGYKIMQAQSYLDNGTVLYDGTF